MTREDDCRALAAAMPGWVFQRDAVPEEWGSPADLQFCIGPVVPVRDDFPDGPKKWSGGVIHVPAPDAPLPEHLEFVGRLSVAIGPDITLDAVNNDRLHGWMVRFSKPWPDLFRGTAPELAHAAIRAALAAKGAT